MFSSCMLDPLFLSYSPRTSIRAKRCPMSASLDVFPDTVCCVCKIQSVSPAPVYLLWLRVSAAGRCILHHAYHHLAYVIVVRLRVTSLTFVHPNKPPLARGIRDGVTAGVLEHVGRSSIDDSKSHSRSFTFLCMARFNLCDAGRPVSRKQLVLG